MVALVGDFVQGAAKARDMEIEGRIGPVRGDNRIAGADNQAHKIAQQPVNPFAHNDIFSPYAMMGRQSLTQIVVFRVAVHPDVLRSRSHGGDGLWGGAEHVFIRAKPCRKAAAPSALLRFGANEGNRSGKGGGKLGIARRFHFRTSGGGGEGAFCPLLACRQFTP